MNAPLQVGIEPRGTVNEIGGTPIQTTFLTVMFTPIFPIASFYARSDTSNPGQPKSGNALGLLINSVSGISNTRSQGQKLKRLHFKSVFFAYLRALCIWFPPLFILNCLRHPEWIEFFVASPLGFCLFLMILLSPLLFFAASHTLFKNSSPLIERVTRSIANDMLGIAIDPKYLPSEDAHHLALRLEYRLGIESISDWHEALFSTQLKSPTVEALLLLRLRCAFGLGAIKESDAMLNLQHELLEDVQYFQA